MVEVMKQDKYLDVKRFLDYINKTTHVTDEIHLNRNDDVALHELWMGDDMKARSVPLDLLIEEHVPLPNIRIIVDERGYLPNGHITNNEVLFFPSALESLPQYAQATKSQKLPVGIVKSKCAGHEIIWFMFAFPQQNSLGIIAERVYLDAQPQTFSIFMAKEFGKIAISILHTWYGIQIALLHPQIKEVFEHKDRTEKANTSFNGSYVTRSTHYIKKHYKSGKIASAIKHHKQRKTLCWWVIGHWREYRNGSKTFIKGYWKGPLREAKQNLDATRIRRI